MLNKTARLTVAQIQSVEPVIEATITANSKRGSHMSLEEIEA